MSAQQDVKEIRARTNVIHNFTYAVFLLTEVTVHLLDDLWCPSREERNLPDVVIPSCLLHVLNVEHLIVEVGFLQNEAHGDFVCTQVRLSDLRLLQGTLAVGHVLS